MDDKVFRGQMGEKLRGIFQDFFVSFVSAFFLNHRNKLLSTKVNCELTSQMGDKIWGPK